MEDDGSELWDKTVAAADTVDDLDLPLRLNIPVVPFKHDGSPEVPVGAEHLTQCGREDACVGEGRLDPLDHSFKAVDLGRNIRAARFRALDAERELEVLLVADQNVREACDLGEDFTQFLFPVYPEACAVIEIEGDKRSVFFGRARKFKAAFAGLGRKRADQAGQVQNLTSLFTENPLNVKSDAARVLPTSPARSLRTRGPRPP